MIGRIKRKKYHIFYIISLLGCLVCINGCDKKKVILSNSENTDGYENDATTQNDLQTNRIEDVSDLKGSLNIPDIVEEEICLDNGENIQVYANVDIGEQSVMNMYSTEKHIYSEEEKKQVLMEWSEDDVIYLGAYDNWPKEYVYDQVIENERVLSYWQNDAGKEPVDEEWMKAMEGAYEEALKRYENAPESWIETEDFSEKSFVVKQDGQMWVLSFFDGFEAVLIESPVCSLGNVAISILGYEEEGFAKLEEYEEFIEIAETKANSLFEGNYRATFMKEVKVGEQEQKLYEIALYRQMDGFPVGGVNINDVNGCIKKNGDQWWSVKNGFERVLISMDEEGTILGIIREWPMEELTTIQEDVPLLSFHNILEVFVEQLQNNPLRNYGNYDGEKVFNFYNTIFLGYTIIENPEKENEYTLVPAWFFESRQNMGEGRGLYVINAMDGTVIEWADIFCELVNVSDYFSPQ